MPTRTLNSDDSALGRLWHGFMTARAMIALALLGLHVYFYLAVHTTDAWVVVVCGLYLMACLAVRLLSQGPEPGRAFDLQWPLTIGIDLVVYAMLQALQSAGINYTALFALPVLLGAVLGSRLLGLATAAAVTLFLLAEATWPMPLPGGTDAPARFLQAGLVGLGLMFEAFLANEIATRLVREERAARLSQLATRTQVRVNELVIESLADGVLVVDQDEVVRVANPAAHRMLALGGASVLPAPGLPFFLTAAAGWQGLAEIARLTLARRAPQAIDAAIEGPSGEHQRVRVRTRLTALHENDADVLCVVFLEDLRELEARIRTEKLAAMGRMSTAVAHEIRNPLAAIAQANALLAEDLTSGPHRQLTGMIQQNAQRLDQIVDEVLNIARIQQPDPVTPYVSLDEVVARFCQDWVNQLAAGERLRLQLATPARVVFNPDHLRRLLVNLLDNAWRYAAPRPGAIVVGSRFNAQHQVELSVWSDAPPLEASVQRHLFEPFFSSESRSTGLGLYICRELCEQHGATIAYRRGPLQQVEGNEFFVTFRSGESALALDDAIIAIDTQPSPLL